MSSNFEQQTSHEELQAVNHEYQSKINKLTQLKEDIEGLPQSKETDVIKQVQQELEQEIIARQRWEEQFKITQQQVENIFSSLEDAIWSFQLPEKTLNYLNDSFELIYGRTKAEFHSNSSLWLEVIHPEDQEIVKQTHEAIRQQEKLNLEYRIIHGDGSIRWVRDRSKLIYNDAGIPIRQDFVITEITEQKKAQQALKAREQTFQAIFNSMFQFIGLLNTEGILLEANQTALDFGGLTAQDVLNRPFWEAKWWTISEDTQERLKKAIALAAEGEFVRYEVEILGANNRIATIDFSLKPVTDETGKVVQLIPEGREISELRKAREALWQINLELEQRVVERTESLAKFSDRLQQLHRLATYRYERLEDLLTDYLETGCQMLDLTTGTINQIEDGCCQIIAGKSPWDLEVGYTIAGHDLAGKEMPETTATITSAELVQNHPLYSALEVKSFIGTPIFVQGKLYGTLNFADTKPQKSAFTAEEIKIIELMARDIGNFIASAQVESALAKSNVRFRHTFEQAAVGMAHVAPEGQFLKVNQRLCQMLNYENNVLLSKTFQEITHPEDLHLDLEYVRQMLAGEIEQYSMEKRYFRSDGSIIWINLTVSLVKEDSGQPDYFISVIEDISDRKKVEFALEANRLELQQANQAKDNFISQMSHEFRTPLNSVIGFSQLLQKDNTLTPQQRKSIAVVHQAGQHLLTLINDVLDLSKLTANKLKLQSREFALDCFLYEISTMFEITAQERGLNFITNISSQLPQIVIADATKLRQILLNLLSNAFKFTNAGTITLSVSPSSDANQGKLRFEVQDTGIGIPQEQYPLIFTSFGQINQNGNNADGTGLGLPICQSLLQLMDSQLNLESTVGQGSRFWFDLELATVETDLLPYSPVNLKQSNVSPAKTLVTPCKILVVDDNQDNRELLVNFLQPWGFMIAEAENGREGLEIAQNFQPEVVLVDLLMPVMDGRTMIQSLREDPQLQNVLAIAISANAASTINCDEFLAKPFDLDRLLQLLEQHLSLRWTTLDVTLSSPQVASNTMITPPLEELEPLWELVNLGNLEAAIARVESLAHIDAQYTQFIATVRQLADNCQQNQLEILLKTTIEQSQ